MLERFYTDAYFGRWPVIDPVLAWCTGARGARFRGRRHPGIPVHLVRDFRSLYIRHPQAMDGQSAAWIRRGRRFATAAARGGFGGANAVYAFTSAAEELFERAREAGVATVLDHATAPRGHEVAIVAAEAECFPTWTLGRGAGADDGVAAYEARQERERDLADRVICGSRYAARLLLDRGVRPDALRVVPLGVHPRFFDLDPATPSTSGLNVLYAGGDPLRKGLGYLIRAVRSLGTSRIRLRVAGDLAMSEQGLREVRQVAERCEAVPRHHMAEWFQWADVLVLPTLSDTFGLVILEAMAAGVPVITTPASGGPDVIREGVDGWIVPVRDADALSSRLEALLADPSMTRAMGAAAKARAREYDLRAYRRRLTAAVNGLAAPHSPLGGMPSPS